MSKLGCVIMASGEGKRFGGNKLMADVYGKPMIGYVLEVTDGLFDKLVVVTRHQDVYDYCRKLGVECVFHNLPYRNDTVKLGVEALLSNEKDTVEHIMFCVGDQPFIKKSTIEKMIDAVRKNPEHIIRAGFADSVGSPVSFPDSLFDELKRLPGKKGGRYLIDKYSDIVKVVQVSDLKELLDIDSRDDLT